MISPGPTLLRDVEVEGQHVDVRLRDGLIREVGPMLEARDESVVHGGGGALLPGLHDHHLHVLALAAARSSVDCSQGLAGLGSAAGSWVRGVGFAESVDRHVLDALVPDRPVRVQHRSGALWMLNSRALREVAHVLGDGRDVERDERGEPTGRLWRFDARLQPALPTIEPDLRALVAELHGYGITSVTDATPDLEPSAVRLLSGMSLPVTMLGDPDGSAPHKVLIRDHDLPSFEELRAIVSAAHSEDRPVAVHCVTRESLLLTLAVLDDVGRLAGDRIEHAAVVPDPTALRGLRVVTQPGFLAHRGDAYARDVDPRDLPYLYPHAGLLGAGVDVVVSSDAPFGPLDPWAVIRAARDRLAPSGLVLGPDERVSAMTALAGYLADADGRPRRTAPGQAADLVLLHCPLATMLAAPDRSQVRSVWSGPAPS
jgi:predicted amidohydrolase YtcJ